MSAEDSEVNLRYILMHASRRSSKIFEFRSTKERREHLVESKVRLEQRQRQRQREEMSYERAPVQAPSKTRRRMMPPAPHSKVRIRLLKKGSGKDGNRKTWRAT